MPLKHTYMTALFLLLLSGFIAHGQSPMGLFFFKTLPQTSTLNPASQPEHDLYISLPSPGFSLQLNPSFSDLFQKRGNIHISPLSKEYDYQRLYSSTGRVGNVNLEAHLDILGLGIRHENHYFGVSFSIKNTSQMNIPSSLFKIPERGFPDNEYFDFSTAHFKQLIYKEISLKYSHRWNDNFFTGLNIKPIWGMAGGISRINKLGLHTSRSEWHGEINARANISGPLTVQDSELEEIPESVIFQKEAAENLNDYLTDWKNGGVAIDLGTIFHTNEQWTFFASMTDIGFLRFRNDLNQMTFKGEYSFTGIKMEGYDQEELEQSIDEISDTLNNLITYDLDHRAFNIWLTPKLHMGASYEINPFLTAGFLTRTVFQKHRWNNELNISALLRPLEFMELNMNYSIRPGGGHGPGAALVIGKTPLQFFIAGDYLPPRYAMVSINGAESFPMLHDQQDLNFKAGINLIFNKPKKRSRYMACPEAYGIY